MKGEPPREYPIQLMEREAGAPESVPAQLILWGMGTVIKTRESKIAGHEVHIDWPWIQILVPGENNKSSPEKPATEVEKRRYPKTYDALVRMYETKTLAVNGMPIDNWPQVTRSMAVTLRAANIPTVEALAEVSDEHIDKIGSIGRDLRSKAKAFLMLSRDTAAAQQIKAESDLKDLRIADLERQFRELAAKLEEGQEEVKRGPGRPRKVQEDAA